MSDNNHKLDTFLYNKIKNISNIKILEFGVREGISTKLFVNLAEKNNGKVFSVDLKDCSNIINSNKWKFIQSRDDNFEFIRYALTKTIVFAFLITSISSYFGYYVNINGGALEVGKASTNAVVYSSIFILFANYILTQLMLI